MRPELLGQQVEKLGVRRRVVVRRSSTGSTMPVPKNRAQTRLTAARAKYGFSGGGHPIGQQVAARQPAAPTSACSRRGTPPSRSSSSRGSPARGGRQPRGSLPYRVVLALLRDPREERSQAPELLALPVVKRMIMTLGALEPDPQERPRRAGSEVLGLGILGNVVRQGRRLGAGGRVRCLLAAPDRPGGPSAPRARSGRSRHPRRPSCAATPRTCRRDAARAAPSRVGLGQQQHAIGLGGVRQSKRGSPAAIPPVPRACRGSGRRGNREPRPPSGSSPPGRDRRGAGIRRHRPAERAAPWPRPIGRQQAVDLAGQRSAHRSPQCHGPRLRCGDWSALPASSGAAPEHTASPPRGRSSRSRIVFTLHLEPPVSFVSTLRGQRQGRLVPGTSHSLIDRSSPAGGQTGAVGCKSNSPHHAGVPDEPHDLGPGVASRRRYQAVVSAGPAHHQPVRRKRQVADTGRQAAHRAGWWPSSRPTNESFHPRPRWPARGRRPRSKRPGPPRCGLRAGRRPTAWPRPRA